MVFTGVGKGADCLSGVESTGTDRRENSFRQKGMASEPFIHGSSLIFTEWR